MLQKNNKVPNNVIFSDRKKAALANHPTIKVHRFTDFIDDAADLQKRRNYWESACTYPSSSAYGQRFGQWIYNNFEVTGAPWPELFYEPNTSKAYSMILDEIYGLTNRPD